MQATRCPLYTSCKLFFNLTKIVYFRMKLGKLQYVNKMSWLYVHQGKHPPINIQNFLYMGILIYFHDICLEVKEQPELLTLPLLLTYYMAED